MIFSLNVKYQISEDDLRQLADLVLSNKATVFDAVKQYGKGKDPIDKFLLEIATPQIIDELQRNYL